MPGGYDEKREKQHAHATASDWDFSSIAELTAALRSRKMSASELLERVIARIEALDRRLNAVVVRDFDRARMRRRQPMRHLPGARIGRCSASP